MECLFNQRQEPYKIFDKTFMNKQVFTYTFPLMCVIHIKEAIYYHLLLKHNYLKSLSDNHILFFSEKNNCLKTRPPNINDQSIFVR